MIIHETKVIPPTEEIPTGSEFKGYQDYTVQELMKRAHNSLYRLAIWKTPTGEYLKGKVPEQVRELGHFGVMLRSYLLYQYHHCHVTQPKLLEQMKEWDARYLRRTIESYHGVRQRAISCGEARDSADWAEGIELYQYG